MNSDKIPPVNYQFDEKIKNLNFADRAVQEMKRTSGKPRSVRAKDFKPSPDLFQQWPFKQCKIVFNFENEKEEDEKELSKTGWNQDEDGYVFHENITVKEQAEFKEMQSQVQNNRSFEDPEGNPEGREEEKNLDDASKDSDGRFTQENSEKQFNCVICNRSFAHLSDLHCHKETHTDEKPFQCSICHGRFEKQSSLTNHERTHSREKPFHCSICKESFTSNRCLKKHKLSHAGEKLYQCLVCGKRYTQSNYFKRHVQTHEVALA